MRQSKAASRVNPLDAVLCPKLTRADHLSSVSVLFRCFSPFFVLPGTKPDRTKRKPKIPRKTLLTDAAQFCRKWLRRSMSGNLPVKTDSLSTPVSFKPKHCYSKLKK